MLILNQHAVTAICSTFSPAMGCGSQWKEQALLEGPVPWLSPGAQPPESYETVVHSSAENRAEGAVLV